MMMIASDPLRLFAHTSDLPYFLLKLGCDGGEGGAEGDG